MDVRKYNLHTVLAALKKKSPSASKNTHSTEPLRDQTESTFLSLATRLIFHWLNYTFHFT